jgi:hypothetical protein
MLRKFCLFIITKKKYFLTLQKAEVSIKSVDSIYVLWSPLERPPRRFPPECYHGYKSGVVIYINSTLRRNQLTCNDNRCDCFKSKNNIAIYCIVLLLDLKYKYEC